MKRPFRILGAALLLVASAAAPGVPSDGRTVAGTIVRLDPVAGTLAVRDAAGASWSYKVDPDAGVDLGKFRIGDRVTVTIRRPTPLNMTTAADRLRKGDRVEKDAY